MGKADSQKLTAPSKDDLSFKPLSSGLGFHPFSDGLPYAPVSKKTQKEDRPRPARPVPQRQAAPFALPSTTPRRPPRIPVVRTQKPDQIVSPEKTAAPAKPQIMGQTPGMAFVAKRVIAQAIDIVSHVGLVGGSFAFILWVTGTPIAPIFANGFPIEVATALYLCHWALSAAEEVLIKTTIGKRLFGLILRGDAVAIFVRAVLFVPSAACFGLGLIWAFFDKRRQCLHDRITGVELQEIARL